MEAVVAIYTYVAPPCPTMEKIQQVTHKTKSYSELKAEIEQHIGNTTIGAVSIPYSAVAAVDDIATDRKEMLEAQNDSLAAFVVESRNKLNHIDFKVN